MVAMGVAEFMRDAAEEAFLAVHEARETRRHAVDRVAQSADLVAASVGHMNLEPALGDLAGRVGHLRDGPCHPPDERQPAYHRDQNHCRHHGQPRFGIEEKLAGRERWRHQDERPRLGVLQALPPDGDADARPVACRRARRREK
jgi:hypothetical protein